MKKQNLYYLVIACMLIVFGFNNLFAAPINKSDIKKAAQQFFVTQLSEKYSKTGDIPVVEILYEEVSSKNSTPYFYILQNHTDGGWIILSSDDRIPPIIGYSFENNMDGEFNPLFIAWMEGVVSEIDYVLDPNNLTSDVRNALYSKSAEEWENLLSGNTPLHGSKGVVGNKSYVDGTDMMDGIVWHQSDDWSPMGDLAPAGCTATAMGQIIKYWSLKGALPNPLQGVGDYFEYYDYGQGVKRSTSFNKTYDLDAMPLDSPTQETRDFLYDLGVSVMMQYRASGSGAFNHFIPYSFYEHFGFAKSFFVSVDMYDPYDWVDMIIDEIYEERPVSYVGYRLMDGGGHSFVISGHNSSNDFFHFNWGWNGRDNGWYPVSLTGIAENIAFSESQGAIFGLEPRTDGFMPDLEFSEMSSYTEYNGCTEENVFMSNAYVKKTYLKTTIKNNNGESQNNTYLRTLTYLPGVGYIFLNQNLEFALQPGETNTFTFDITDLLDNVFLFGYSPETFNLFIGRFDGLELSDYAIYPFLLERTNSISCDYELNLSASPPFGGEVIGGGIYPPGTNVTVTAIPNQNYIFINWTKNNVQVSTDAEYSFDIDAKTNLVANFKYFNGVNEQINSELKIYPNPTNGELRVDASTSLSAGRGEWKIFDVEVYNIIGKQQDVKTNFESSLSVVLDVSCLPSGVYWVKIVTEKGVATKKIFKN